MRPGYVCSSFLCSQGASDDGLRTIPHEEVNTGRGRLPEAMEATEGRRDPSLSSTVKQTGLPRRYCNHDVGLALGFAWLDSQGTPGVGLNAWLIRGSCEH
jgi:hypothetical protein